MGFFINCFFFFCSSLIILKLFLFSYINNRYGWVFLYETYLYHIVRGDIRHNFSPYFYLLYLTSDPVNGVPLCLRLLVFIPQLVLVVAVALRCHHDQPLAWFLCTFIFVMANKVCTSQVSLFTLLLTSFSKIDFRLVGSKKIELNILWHDAVLNYAYSEQN